MALCDPRGCSPPGSSIHGILQIRILEWVAFPSPGDLPDIGIESQSPALQADSLRAELPGKPKNTGVGSLFLLQGIFLTQESNQGLLHCRRILYRLSYQGRIVSSVQFSLSVMCDPLQPHVLQPTRLLRPWDFFRQEFWSGVPLPSPMRHTIYAENFRGQINSYLQQV